jgi:uncharacterized protein (TIGR02271 family)
VTVRVPEQHVSRVTDILERHNPVDLDDRASSYGLTGTTTTTRTSAAPMGTTSAASAGDTIQLAEESLSVGKRAVNRGTTRIRRYVVETPVEEQVTLRTETVSVDRRPVQDSRPVTDAAFTETVVEMSETSEEAVVGKTARVKEEVLLRKDATERVETVKDTVRREDIAVEQVPSTEQVSARRGRPSGNTSCGKDLLNRLTPGGLPGSPLFLGGFTMTNRSAGRLRSRPRTPCSAAAATHIGASPGLRSLEG